MDQTIRNKLRGVVTQCRKLLEDSTAQTLQGRFGIYASRKKGEVQIEDEARMAHLTEEDRTCRQDLLDHLEHIRAIGYKPSEALEQLVREISFTHLNRLCANKMMESRGLIREAVSRGLKSQGFFFYLADHPEDQKLHNGGGQETAYRNFLDWLGGTLSQEIGVLFNPNDPANRIYPPQRVLDEVLALINDGELKDIWSQDETIGWVYQYFTPKEMRDKARKESQAPRNSYELAFRNQFFTPRYVVEFLTDNTLGRIWYEMRKGETVLRDRCRYLVRRPTEIFLKEGEELPAESKDVREDLSQEELLKQPVYIPHRPKKDPREIKVLDPACGSGHFLLYCFDLLQVVYEEAYDDPNLSAALRRDYPTIEDLQRVVPGLILKHNLHGIDIDLRATQIAALALWLRCQRAYQALRLKNGERPKITRSNIVCAEPMPGETDLLKEFTATLQPKVLGQLVEAVFEKMKLAGEAGSLLKIEEEIREAASTAKKEYQEELRRRREQAGYLPGMAPPRERTLFDFSDMTDSEFLDRAEEEIVAALRQYAEKASNRRGFRRRLFAEDASRGFAFVDICRKQFDVVVMNPPYGDASSAAKDYLQCKYGGQPNDLFGCFIERCLAIADYVGALTSRTFLFFSSFESLRTKYIFPLKQITAVVDLGFGVLDGALVETCAMVLKDRSFSISESMFVRLNDSEEKGSMLVEVIDSIHSSKRDPRLFPVRQSVFEAIDGAPMPYWVGQTILNRLLSYPSVYPDYADVKLGAVTSDNDRFLRLRWEVDEEKINPKTGWASYAKGGDYSKYFGDIHLLIYWKGDGEHIKLTFGQAVRLRELDQYLKPGLTYPLVTVKGMNVRVLPANCVFDNGSPSIFVPDSEDRMATLGVLNSRLVELYIRCFTSSRHWQVGYVRKIPWPARNIVSNKAKLKESTTEVVHLSRTILRGIEPTAEFLMPRLLHSGGDHDCLSELLNEARKTFRSARNRFRELEKTLDDIVKQCYAFSPQEWSVVEKEVPALEESRDQFAEIAGDGIELVGETISWTIGCVLGRWDIRFSTGERQSPELPDPFDPLPVCLPGMLQGPDGLPAKPEEILSDYPVRIDWDGILVDDPGHEDDIVRRVRDVLEVIWKDRAEAIEKDACEILGVRELRDYFRKPGNGGFWMDHVKRYSKSRRKAPIYWYLRSAKGNYGLWLYYHRLDKDILFKALINYVEPKIRLEEDRLRNLRIRKEAVGGSGREAKQIEKDMDGQEQFVSELFDFADRLRRAASLRLEPDLNDGVVLNIAPLFELLPWKEAKEYWEDLVAGKYEWSSIGKQMREKRLVKK